METRLLTGSDAAAWWRLRLEALQHEPEAFGASVEEHLAMGIEGAAERLNGDPAQRFVAGGFEDQTLIATAGFYREQSLKRRHEGHIWGVYVTGSARGRGASRRLLQFLIARAAAVDGIEQIALTVTTTQPAAMALYRSLGFQPFGCQERALKVDGRYISEEYLVLYLDPRRQPR